jgi:PAS domain S-box-containing protein
MARGQAERPVVVQGPAPAELAASVEAILWLADPVARLFTYVSDAAESLLGFEPEVWLAEPNFGAKLIYAEDRAEALAAFGRAIETGESQAVEYRLLTKDGRLVWLHASLRPAGRDGRVEQLGGVMLDVTEQKRVEQRLLAQYAVTSALAEAETLEAAAPRIIEAICDSFGWSLGELWMADESGGLLRLVESWHRPGIEAASFVAASRKLTFQPGTGLPGRVLASGEAAWIRDVVVDSNFPRAAAAEAAGLHGACAFPIIRRGRPLGVFEFFAPAVREPDEDSLAMMEATASQIGQFSEQREAEDARRASEARAAAILASALDCIITIDAAGCVVEFNEAAEQTFGYRREDVLGVEMCELIVPEDLREAHRRGIAHYLESGEGPILGKRLELPALRADGSTFPAELTVVRVDLPGPPLFTGYVRDITERRHLEEQLRQAQKMEAIGQLAGGIAHDFNNIALVISGHSGVLLDLLPEEGQERQSASEIRRAAERASSLTRQLLAFSRRQVLQPEEVDLSAAIDGIRPMLDRLIGENIQLSTTLPLGLGSVRADPGQLEQVLLNLVLNARDAMPNGGRLSVGVSAMSLDAEVAREWLELAPGPYFVLAVSDTGQGMDAATRERIFEPFFTTKEPGKGTGLGLATVYGIVKQSSGSIWVYSEPDCGTTVKVYLPRFGGAGESERRREPRRELLTGTETVLLVEDDEQARTLVHLMLEQLGYSVLTASNGGEALALCEAHAGPIDLLVTDLVMPGMSGREVADLVTERRPDTRVLFMSGYTDDMLVHLGIERGAAYLQKPYDENELARRVRDALES